MQTVLEAIVDPTRRQIVELLREGDRSAGELAGEFAISRPAVSRHLRVLRTAGLVHSRGDAQRRIYSLDTGPLRDLDAWLAHYRAFWPQRLDALDESLRRSTVTEDAVVARRDGGLELRFERHYPVDAEQLWAHLTQPEHLAVWLPEATITPGPRGHLDFDWGEQGTGRAPVRTWEPPRVLELTWVETHGVASVVRFELEPATSPERGTLLTLVHRDITEDAAGNGAGWHYYLDALAAHVEGRRSPGDERFEELLKYYSETLQG